MTDVPATRVRKRVKLCFAGLFILVVSVGWVVWQQVNVPLSVHCQTIQTLQLPNTLFQQFAFTSDGQIALATARLADDPGTEFPISYELLILELPSLKVVKRQPLDLRVQGMCYSPDGQYLALAGVAADPSTTPGQIQIWPAALGQPLFRQKWFSPQLEMQWELNEKQGSKDWRLTSSPDVVVFSANSAVLHAIDDYRNERCEVHFKLVNPPMVLWDRLPNSVTDIAVDQTGGKVAGGSTREAEIFVWSLDGFRKVCYLEPIAFFPEHTTRDLSPVWNLSWSPNGRNLFTNTGSGGIAPSQIDIWDIHSHKSIYTLPQISKEELLGGAFHPQEPVIAIALSDFVYELRNVTVAIEFYDFKHQTRVASFAMNRKALVYEHSFSPDGRHLVLLTGYVSGRPSVRDLTQQPRKELLDWVKRSKIIICQVDVGHSESRHDDRREDD